MLSHRLAFRPNYAGWHTWVWLSDWNLSLLNRITSRSPIKSTPRIHPDQTTDGEMWPGNHGWWLNPLSDLSYKVRLGSHGVRSFAIYGSYESFKAVHTPACMRARSLHLLSKPVSPIFQLEDKANRKLVPFDSLSFPFCLDWIHGADIQPFNRNCRRMPNFFLPEYADFYILQRWKISSFRQENTDRQILRV